MKEYVTGRSHVELINFVDYNETISPSFRDKIKELVRLTALEAFDRGVEAQADEEEKSELEPKPDAYIANNLIDKGDDVDKLYRDCKRIIAEQLNVSEDSVIDDAQFTIDLGADSLDLVELVMAFEEVYEIEINDFDAEKISSLREVVAYLLKVNASFYE